MFCASGQLKPEKLVWQENTGGMLRSLVENMHKLLPSTDSWALVIWLENVMWRSVLSNCVTQILADLTFVETYFP